MRIIPLTLSLLLLSACVTEAGETVANPDPLPALALQQDNPRLALLEHMLAGYFESDVINRPTVCAAWYGDDGQLGGPSAGEETALIARFPQLAPMARCTNTAQGWQDSETGEAAMVFTIHEFACASDTSCSAWGGYRSNGGNSMSYLYNGEWDGARWQFTRDMRIIAE
ncbi:hypothetical protein [Aurantiacibacter zhengii]|uniref:DUF4440 domain-containing protein n=1 Tax=Aurantiacibacter zhengii TaxID=2307003 RepID=A0A418NWN5_9SPHN|nr:hypothetical protein [Aurantiacibacter zhengii]RIV89041.1 hypothetical protein D2V07_01940 [Aurantiacibacter zhengii]